MNTAYQNSIISKEEGEALINAAIHNKPNEIQKLINLGVNLNYRAQDGYTALNNAVLLNHEKIANMLLSQPSVDVNIPNNYGLAPAYFAHKYNRLPMLDSIIKHPTFDLEFNLVIVNDLEKYEYKHYLHSINSSSLPFLDAYQQAKLFAMKYEFNECLTFKHVDNHHFHCFEMKGYANRLGAIGMADSFANFYDIIVANSHLPSWAQSAFVSVNEALEFCATIFEPSVYYQRYQLGELVIIPSGWDRHSIVFVVCDDKLYRCNRGDMSDGIHGIEEFVITKPDKFTVEVFDHMLQASGTPDYLQNQIIDILGLHKIGEVANPTQIMGNCVWTSLEAGLEASLLSNFLNSGVENSEAHLLAKQSFTVWEEFDLSYTLKTAIDNIEKLNYYEIFDDLVVNVLQNHHDVNSEAALRKGVVVLEQLSNPLVFEKFQQYTYHILHSSGIDEIQMYDDYLSACHEIQLKNAGLKLSVSEILDVTNVSYLDAVFNDCIDVLKEGIHFEPFLPLPMVGSLMGETLLADVIV